MRKFALCLIFVFIFCALSLTYALTREASVEKIKELIVELPDSTTVTEIDEITNLSYARAQLKKFSPTLLTYDKSLVKGKDEKVLEKLIEAADYIDQIFLRQAYYKNEEILKNLQNSTKPEDEIYLRLFKINYGPFDRLREFETFYGTGVHPKGANYYPVDMTKEEFDSWLTNHPGDKKTFTDTFTVIRRQGDGLVAVPYPQEYKDLLEPAHKALKEAARLTDSKDLKSYLNSRADALLSNDYFQSDMDWMDLNDSTFEVVIGPYEVYEDTLFNYKGAYEAFITLNDPVEAEKLEKYGTYLGELEKNLPIADEHKNFKRRLTSPIKVVQLIYSAGDTRAGVQTLAFNLPNDERVREAKGSKKVMLKNVIEGKFDKILTPICEKLINPSQQKYLSFQTFFDQILSHELAHGIGPGIIIKDGKETTVAKCLKNNYSAIEEAKADTLGAYNLLYLMKTDRYPEEKMESLMVDYLAGMFRSIRFGIHEAHGRGVILQFNWMMQHGGFVYDKNTGYYSVNFDKFKPALDGLVKKLLEIEATGNYEESNKLLKAYCYLPGYLQNSLNSLNDLPVDLLPVYEVKQNPIK
ncbi:MAG: peptidase [Armatimonadota bacterium]